MCSWTLVSVDDEDDDDDGQQEASPDGHTCDPQVAVHGLCLLVLQVAQVINQVANNHL